ncbi:YbjN domain-containing protein [Micromonospora yangpuensis]
MRRYQRYAVEAMLGTPRVGLAQGWAMLDDLVRRSSPAGDRAPVPVDGPDAGTVPAAAAETGPVAELDAAADAGPAPGPHTANAPGPLPGPDTSGEPDPVPGLDTAADAGLVSGPYTASAPGPVPGLDTAANAGPATWLDKATDAGPVPGLDEVGGQVVAGLRCRIADHVGDEPAARRWYERWRTAEPDPASGCVGCLPVRRAELLAGWGDHRGALAELGPVLAGTVDCTDQPAAALAVALLPWLRSGEPHRAAAGHVRAYRRHRREWSAFGYLAAHLRFCALSGNPARGLAVLAEQLPRLDRAPDDRRAMEFAAAGALVCAVAAEAGLAAQRIHRPAYGTRPAADLDVGALGADLLAVATALAGSFDARNGTGHQSGRIAGWLAERPTGPAVPLPADGPDSDGSDIGGPDGDGPHGSRPAGGKPHGATQDVPGDRAPGDDYGQDVLGGTSDVEPMPLSLSMITATLDSRGDGYAVDATGTVLGRWGSAVIQFQRIGERGDILQARVAAVRRLPATRRAEAYRFCNAWNHDRLQPRAYVHDLGNGELVLAGDVNTDLAYGVAPVQLAVLVDAAVTTATAYADAVAALG